MNILLNIFRGVANILMIMVCAIVLFYGMADYGRNPQQIMNDYITEEYGEEYTGVILDAPGLEGDDYRVKFEVYDDHGMYKDTVRV